MDKKIGILYICTGKYTIFWKDFYLSMEKNFIEESDKHYFVFTDSDNLDFESENPRIHKIYQENLGWPNNTLKRFHVFLKAEEELSKMDYLFFFNANLLIQEKITAKEFLPTPDTPLLATIHPGFYNKKVKKFTYDRNKKSQAFINKKEGKYYFAGGLNGGIAKDFLEAVKLMKNMIDIVIKNNVIPLWHDESIWNKYLLNRNGVKIISPSYLYPEGWDIPFDKKILIRDKNKYGGHSLLREQNYDNNKIIKIIRGITVIIKKIFFSKKSFPGVEDLNLKNEKLIITTICFNDSSLVKLQYKYITQNIKDNLTYLVADNSNDTKASKDIYLYCLENKITYIKLPRNLIESNPSKSHGRAINWVYYNIIKKYEPNYFGFIDHDIFPFKQSTMIEKIKNDGIYGLIQTRDNGWYLWPGFCFYDFKKIKNYKLDFMPCRGLDTGGTNYYSIYKNVDVNLFKNINHSYFDIDKEKETESVEKENSTVEVIADWVHLMKSSNWNNQKLTKKDRTEEIIEKCLKFYN